MSEPPTHVDGGAPAWCDFSFPTLNDVPCRHADESIVCSIAKGDKELIVIALMVRHFGGPGGMFIALPPAEAREVATGLLERANRLDGGKGKQ